MKWLIPAVWVAIAVLLAAGWRRVYPPRPIHAWSNILYWAGLVVTSLILSFFITIMIFIATGDLGGA